MSRTCYPAVRRVSKDFKVDLLICKKIQKNFLKKGYVLNCIINECDFLVGLHPTYS